MPRAVILADFDEFGGTGTYLLRLAEFACRRYSTRIVLHGDRKNSPMVPALRGAGAAVTFDYCLFPRLDDFLFRVSRRLDLQNQYNYFRDRLVRRRIEHRYVPDLFLISQGGGCRYFAFLTSPLPVVIVTHSLFLNPVRSERLGFLYLRLFRGRDLGNKAICCVSQYARELFARNVGLKELSGIATCVPNFGLRHGRPGAAREGLTLILTLGHVVEYKNPIVWLEAAKRIVRKYRGRVRFVWAGAGPMLDEMRELARPEPEIEFVGFREDPSELYASADIYFQPSLWESQGISVVEAMARSIPCVVSSAGGLPESIEDGVEGFVRDPASIEGFADALSTLIEDEGARARLGAGAKKKYEALFTKEAWEANMASLVAFVSRPGQRSGPDGQGRKINDRSMQ
jgi:glycosyltransferase involved in cell wall biosynthesis